MVLENELFIDNGLGNVFLFAFNSEARKIRFSTLEASGFALKLYVIFRTLLSNSKTNYLTIYGYISFC